jgi:long-chain acyl-CoA synthetase
VAIGSTIPAIVAAHVAAHGSETILRKKDRGIWKAVTWAELGSHVQAIAAGLVASGFGPGQVAAVLSQTRPEAAYASLAILAVGGACVAVHPDEEAERVCEILRSAQCRLLFVENEEQLDKALTVRATCPSLQRIVIFDLKGLREFSDPGCVGLAAFRGSGAPALAISADMPAILVFPSAGKSRLLTHGDVMHLLASAGGMLDVRPGDERLAVLPMSTLMEHVLGLHLALMTRCISNYLESPETAVENLQEVQPTVFGADAEAWLRLHGRIERASRAATRVQGALYRWAVVSQGGVLARVLVLNAVRRELGLHHLRIAYVCGAPVHPDVLVWASALGITIQRIDGPTKRGVTVDARSRALMEEAYSAT